MRIITLCLLDPQGLDGGGLLTHEEAQPLEAGLMIGDPGDSGDPGDPGDSGDPGDPGDPGDASGMRRMMRVV